MNLSSVLITCKKEKIATLEEEIKKISFCSVELAQDDKIVVIIESENLDEELNAYKKLENLKDIVSINMVFSYQDLDEEREKILKENFKADDFDEKIKQDDLQYYGNIYKKY